MVGDEAVYFDAQLECIDAVFLPQHQLLQSGFGERVGVVFYDVVALDLH